MKRSMRWVWLVVAAAAVMAGADEGSVPALLALNRDPEKLGSVSLGDGGTVTVEQGDVQVNGGHDAALYLGEGARLRAAAGEVGVVGGCLAVDGSELSPAAHETAAVDDPLAALVVPGKAPVISKSMLFVGKSATLKPGIYQGGLLTAAKVKVTLQPGIYLFVDGDATFQGCTVSGTGVTLVIGGAKPGSLSFGAKSKVSLTAPTGGPTKGVVAVVKGESRGLSFYDTATTLGGTIYAPKSQVLATSRAKAKVGRVICQDLMVIDHSELTITGQ